MPERIQRKRTKGWRMPEGAVYVGRPTQWGNPFDLSTAAASVRAFRALVSRDYKTLRQMGHVLTAGMWLSGRTEDRQREWLSRLRGKDLACWCPLDQPCHADVLLEIANQ